VDPGTRESSSHARPRRHRPRRDLAGSPGPARWHYVLTGGVLASLSQYGFDAMTGRWAYLSDSADGCAAALSPTETPQVRDTAADPHRNPTDGTAHSGTLVMHVKDTENSR